MSLCDHPPYAPLSEACHRSGVNSGRQEVLGDGLRRELAQQIETMLAKTSFEPLEANGPHVECKNRVFECSANLKLYNYMIH